MLKLPINITDTDIQYITDSNTQKQLTQRRNMIIKKYSDFQNIEQILENTSQPFKRCAFCGSVSKIRDIVFVNIDDITYIKTIEYVDDLYYCRRRDTPQTKECRGKKLNSNSKEYVMLSKGFNSIEEANTYILERNSSPFYRTNYDSDEEYSNAQRRDRDFFKTEDKWNEYRDRQAYTNSKEYYIEKYGDKGVDEWNKLNAKKDSSSLEHHIEKYGEEDGVKSYSAKCKRSDSASYSYLERKYGKEADKIISYRKTLPYYIEKYGDEGKRIFTQNMVKRNNKPSSASNESQVNLFIPLIDSMGDLDIEYHVGIYPKKEYMIYHDNKKMFFDFCIPELKIIVEYHGSRWHYNKDYDYSYLLENNKWSAFPSIETMKERDSQRRQAAEKHGYTLFEVFDTADFKEEYTIIYKIIRNRYEARNRT